MILCSLIVDPFSSNSKTKAGAGMKVKGKKPDTDKDKEKDKDKDKDKGDKDKDKDKDRTREKDWPSTSSVEKPQKHKTRDTSKLEITFILTQHKHMGKCALGITTRCHVKYQFPVQYLNGTSNNTNF